MTQTAPLVRGLDGILPPSCSWDGKLRVCILTPDISGPIRNGGVATAYRHLAELLAACGHEVTILFTLGRYRESGTFSDWVQHYASKGILLLPPPECSVPPVDGLVGAVTHTARRAYEALASLDQFDLVHTPEWGGHAYYALMAKHLGLDFQETTFCLTTHGPHLWGLEGNLQHVTSKESVA